MGINYNPRGVSEGLIYYIDPYNNRSYSGTGNTVYNLVNSSIGGTFVGSTASPIDSTSTRTFYMGGSNYINCPNNIPLTNNFTVSVWFKLNAYNNSSIINKWFADSSPTNHRSWFIGSETSSSSVVVVLSSDGTYTNPTIKRYAVPVNLNEYTNITFTFATGTLTVYKNGLLTTVTKSLDASFTTVYDNPTRPIQIGYGYDSGNYYGLANVGITQIYNRVLSPTEILQNYDAVEKRYYPEENIVRDGLILNLDPGNSRSYAGAGNTIYDLSGTGNSGNLINGPAFSPVNNGHFVFDGVNDTIRINNTMFGTLYSKATSYSCDLWMYINSTQNYTSNPDNDIVENSGNYPFVIRYERPLLKTAVYDGVNNPQSSIAFIRDTWIHFTLVVNYANNTASSYLNGVLASTFSVASVTDTLSVTNLYLFSRSESINWTTGKLGPFHMYRKALSPEEVLQNYNATKNRFINVLPPVRDNLILNLDAGDLASYPGSGTTWFDLSGSNNTSVLTNGPTYTYSDSLSNFLFDGSNDYVVVNSNANLLSKTEYTKFVFFYATSFSTANNLISGGVSGTNHAFWLNFSNRLYAGHNASWSTVTGSTTLSTNTWYCGAVTYSNVSGWKLYLNGVLDGTSATSTTFDNSGELLIAAYANANVFTGRIPLALVYNRALSAAEIAQNFNFYRTRYGI
jgi:hypothetical protein